MTSLSPIKGLVKGFSLIIIIIIIIGIIMKNYASLGEGRENGDFFSYWCVWIKRRKKVNSV